MSSPTSEAPPREIDFKHCEVTGWTLLVYEDDPTEVYGRYTSKAKARGAKRGYDLMNGKP